jgi:peroxiredoxin (alkyl hydroperoxide reductase subunit C)
MKGGQNMPEMFKPGCQRPKSKIKFEDMKDKAVDIAVEKEDSVSMIQVGKAAPNFEAAAYYDGQFVNVSLEEYKGKWVVLCFYPGDFTFV